MKGNQFMEHRMKKTVSAVLAATIVISFATTVSLADENQKWNLGDLTNTGLDNGYSGENAIDLDDPHYGWTLGQFYVTGYTQRTTDENGEDVFLKNVGDQVELHFELYEDIDCLNGDSNMSIFADANGYDQYFGTQQYNDCRGLLIIRKTDYQNATADPVVYTNYLDGVDQGADTVVEFCEEGDYEVALDYEIKVDNYGVDWNTLVSVPTYTNYRISFKFKIRNGNCMVFPFDTTTGSELQNEAYTENGFYLDLANSRYLEINVQRAVYVEGADGYTEDIRSNKPAADGAEYTDEGIYTITVSNLYTGQTTTKVIYVGTDPKMKAYVVTGYSLEDIDGLIAEGYTINDDGTIVAPEGTSEVVVDNSSEIVSTDATTGAVVQRHTPAEGENKDFNPIIIIIPIVVVVIVAGVGVFLFLSKKKKNENAVVSNNAEKGALQTSIAEGTTEIPIEEATITEESKSLPVEENATNNETTSETEESNPVLYENAESVDEENSESATDVDEDSGENQEGE